MARIQRDNFHGGYRVTGLEHDIRKAQQDARFRQDMSNIGNQAIHDITAAPGSAMRTTAGVAAGGIAVGVGMVGNRKFRYIVQAILHFPMAWFLVFLSSLPLVFLNAENLTNEQLVPRVLVAVLIASLASVIWSLLYILLRTRRKLQRLTYEY